MMVAYPPALFFPDSWGYLDAAYAHSVVGLQTRWPAGYPALIALLTEPGHDLLQLTAAQHLVGLGCGMVVYSVLVHAGTGRWAAAAAAALVLLDGYAITLEQYVMSDTFAGATVLAVTILLAWGRITAGGLAPPRTLGLRRAALAGVLLAAAVLQREASMFIAPVILIYLFWIRAHWRAVLVLIACAVIPLGGYASLVEIKFHVYGITAASGWTLYGRVGGFADCKGLKLTADLRPLCETSAQRSSHPSEPDWYIWGPSPAVHLFSPDTSTVEQSARANSLLESFSREIIVHQPLALASATFGDFLRYFTPGATPYRDSESATSLPATVHNETIRRASERKYLPGLHPEVRSPSALLRSYKSAIHVPRPVLAVLALAALLALLMRVPSRREIFLYAGAGVSLLLGTAATGGFALRYLIPAVAPLAIGGTLAVSEATARLRQARVQARPPSSVS
jgi:hypothetical protein